MSVMGDSDRLTSREILYVSDKKDRSKRCCSTLKMFIIALSFAYFSKALSGTYMKSAITQIERRFDLSSSLIGLIDGSFEMGNLLFLAFVSHFGAKMHRPRLIGMGCFLMAVGSALTGLPHFFMGRYTFDTVIQSRENNSLSISPCRDPTTAQGHPDVHIEISQDISADCVKDGGSHMWIYVFLGNALRGIGETPVTPLGISYIDDYAKAENSAFYIACLQTITLLGPMFGFLLGSMCARIYVDIGYVDVESVTITPKDARWVGAWWLGFFVSSGIMLLSGVPFWFLPRSLPRQGELPANPYVPPASPAPGTSTKFASIAKGFLPSLKRLLTTPTYFLLLCGAVLKFNSFIGLLTFKAKYMEQQFGQSASRANFLIGVLNLPVVAVGIFLGGLLMKRYRLSVVAGAQLSFLTSLTSYLLLLLQYSTKCDNVQVAGLTAAYNGTPLVSFDDQMLFSECNRKCSCAVDEWDPVCSQNGITYMSPCLAGCNASTGHGKHTVFHNCSCVLASSPVDGSTSVRLGQCPRGPDCSRSFTSYMAVSVLSSFINSLGTTPGYMVVIRCIRPELKSLALGIQTLVMRTLGSVTVVVAAEVFAPLLNFGKCARSPSASATLARWHPFSAGGIPAPVYFGALIDSTCLKWGAKRCGGRGACRMYDTDMYRVIFLGLITCLSGCSYFFIIAVIVLLRRQFNKEKAMELENAPDLGDMELFPPHQHLQHMAEGGGEPAVTPTPRVQEVEPNTPAGSEIAEAKTSNKDQQEGTEKGAELPSERTHSLRTTLSSFYASESPHY